VLFQLHLWIGVITGLYIAVVCTTGAALVFRIDMQRALHPDLFTPKASGPPAHPADIMDSVKRAFPDDRVSGVDAPTTGRPTYLAYSSQGTRFRTLLLDPVSGELLGELPDTSFVRTLQDLHFDLLAGRRGRVINGIGALGLLMMCVTGIVIWWPGRVAWWRSVRVDFSRSWRRVNWELHNAIGFWTAILIAMWAVTGVYFAFPATFRALVNELSPITVARTPQSGPDTHAPAPAWRALVDDARRRAPDGYHVARVVLPSTPTGAVSRDVLGREPDAAGSGTDVCVSRSVHGSVVDIAVTGRGQPRRLHHGVGGSAARGQLRGKWCARSVDAARPRAAAALRHRLSRCGGRGSCVRGGVSAPERSRLRALSSANPKLSNVYSVRSLSLSARNSPLQSMPGR
jgi:hypothetical protein